MRSLVNYFRITTWSMLSKNKWIFLFLILLAACNPGSKNQSDRSSIEEAGKFPEGFETFYERFHLDSAYQMSHIIFPLEGREKNRFEDSDLKWEADSWKLHKPFNTNLTDFDQQFSVINNAVIEVIEDKYSFSKIERRFAKISGDWFLIYYSFSRIGQ